MVSTPTGPVVIGWAAAGSVAAVAILAEVLHFRRVGRSAPLAFGPGRPFAGRAARAAAARVLALALLVWGLAVLLTHPPRVYDPTAVEEKEYRHLVLVLDVSPSMQLQDAGPGGTQSRSERAADLIQSFFERVPADRYKTTVIAFYTTAKPVVKDTADREVVRNALTELPLRHAFKPGETNIFAGLELAAEIAKPWPPSSAAVVLVTDGDTVPAAGMPKMPPSVGDNVAVIGVGDPTTGRSIAGHNSRQDVSTLRQTATRLRGAYHDGNQKHLATNLVARMDERAAPRDEDRMTAREWALAASGVGGCVLALLPVALAGVGTGWRPGRRV